MLTNALPPCPSGRRVRHARALPSFPLHCLFSRWHCMGAHFAAFDVSSTIRQGVLVRFYSSDVAILVSTVRLTIHPSSLVQALVARGSFLWFTRCYARCYCCFLLGSHSSRRLSCIDSTRYVSASRMFVCRFWLSLTLRSIFLFHLRQPSSPGTCATTWRFARSVLFCSGSHFLARALPFNPRKPTRCVA